MCFINTHFANKKMKTTNFKLLNMILNYLINFSRGKSGENSVASCNAMYMYMFIEKVSIKARGEFVRELSKLLKLCNIAGGNLFLNIPVSLVGKLMKSYV